MRSLEEVPEVWGSTGKSKEEVSFGAEKSNGPSKNRPKSGSKRGRARKTEISGRKRWGGGEAKKWVLLPILQCYEVAK